MSRDSFVMVKFCDESFHPITQIQQHDTYRFCWLDRQDIIFQLRIVFFFAKKLDWNFLRCEGNDDDDDDDEY